jgi:alkyl sulfatase BDS1-like metallo-beta-lactamase superfamily hydrolase
VVLPRYSEVVAETGRNLAYDQPAATVDPLGFQQMNINWRNFYLSAALELEGHLDRSRYSPKRGTAILERLPLVNLLEKMLTRIDAEQTQDVHMTVPFHLADSGQDYALEIRRGIVQLHRRQPPHADVTLSGNEDDLRRMLLRQTSFLKEWALGRIHVDGSTSDMARFFGYFDPPAETPPNLVVR